VEEIALGEDTDVAPVVIDHHQVARARENEQLGGERHGRGDGDARRLPIHHVADPHSCRQSII
jgi:hypothetical protein